MQDELLAVSRYRLSCFSRITLEFCGAAVPAAPAGETHAPQLIFGQSLPTSFIQFIKDYLKDVFWFGHTAGADRAATEVTRFRID